MTVAVAAADNKTPSVANVAMGTRSVRNSRQFIYRAASNIRGGSSISKTNSLLKGTLIWRGKSVIKIPANTRPTVYGILSLRATTATIAPTVTINTICSILIDSIPASSSNDIIEIGLTEIGLDFPVAGFIIVGSRVAG